MGKNARTFGQDLMRGEYVVGGGGVGKTSAERYGVDSHLDEKAQRALGCFAAHGGAGAIDRNTGGQTGTSIFDPVLCELSYRWFCPPNGKILDPFAGGSVRGVVASCLGFEYTGVELRAEQVAANAAQAHIGAGPEPKWITGDSRGIGKLAAGQYDMLFSCPPYADLEVYSDNPADLSTLPYTEFRAAYETIIAESCALLKPDRFAVFVVGDVRDKAGNYYGFPWHTIEAFQKAGLHLYNDAILVTAAGSLPIRAGKQFRSGRKLGKTHQNVLCFVKGDGKRAAAACQAANDNAPAQAGAA